MPASRLCLIVSAVLFVIAAILAFGIVKADVSVEGIALLAFAFWVGAGAA